MNPVKWLTFIAIISLPVRIVAWTWYTCTNTYTHNHDMYEKRSYVWTNMFAGNRHGNCSTYHDIRERGGDWLCGTLLWSVWNIHWWVPIAYIVIILQFVKWISNKHKSEESILTFPCTYLHSWYHIISLMPHTLIHADNNRFPWLTVANFLYVMLHLATNLFLCFTNVATQDCRINTKTENFTHTHTHLLMVLEYYYSSQNSPSA